MASRRAPRRLTFLWGSICLLLLALSFQQSPLAARAATPPPADGPYPYIIEDLQPANYPADNVQATAINSGGMIVGSFFDTQEMRGKSFFWANGVFTPFEGPGACLTNALDVNDSGIIAGVWYVNCDHGGPGSPRKGFLYDTTTGTFTTLGPSASGNSYPFRIANDGTVIGQVGLENGAQVAAVLAGTDMVRVTQNADSYPCPSPAPTNGRGCALGFARDIAPDGTIYGVGVGVTVCCNFGFFGDEINGAFFSLSNGQATFYDNAAPFQGGALVRKVNSSGVVVGGVQGNSNDDPYLRSAAFSFSGGQATLYPKLREGDGIAVAQSINDAGVIVGYSGDADAVIYQGPNAVGTTSLLSLIDPDAGWVRLRSANDINNNGWITGYGGLSQGQTHAFVVRPNTDFVAPTSTAFVSPAANGAGYNNGDVTITLNATDNEQGRGVRLIRYTINDWPSQTIQGDNGTIALTNDGVYTISYFAKDQSGNAESPHTLTVRIDRGMPYLQVTTNAGSELTQIGQTVTITVAATEPLAAPPSVSLSPGYGDACLPVTVVPMSASGATTYTGSYTVPENILGVCLVQVDASGGDLAGNSGNSGSAFFNIQGIKRDQTITFDPIPDQQYGDYRYPLNLSASSLLPTDLVVSGACRVFSIDDYGNRGVEATGVGTCTLTASQAGNDGFNPAQSMTQQFQITKATTTILWSSPAAIAQGTPLNGNQLNAQASYGYYGNYVPGTYNYSPDFGAILPVGIQTLNVTFTPNDPTLFEAATGSTTVELFPSGTPGVTIQLPAGTIREGAPVTLTASVVGMSSNGLNYAWTVTKGGATIASATGNPFTFTPDDNGSYSARVEVTTGGGGGGVFTRVGGVSLAAVSGGQPISATKTVKVANVVPTATFEVTKQVQAGGTISLALSNVTDISQADRSAGFTYGFDCGDGAGFGPYVADASTTCATATSGKRTVKARVRDKDNGVKTYSASVIIDGIAPATTATRSPAANQAGWNKVNTTVKLVAKDNTGGVGVASITYSASGAQPIASTMVNASSANVPIATEGETTVTYFATDKLGNVEAQGSIVVKLDKTDPMLTMPTGTFTIPATSPAGAAYTFNTSVNDNLDLNPLLTCSHTSGTTFPIGTTTVSCTAKDQAGNDVTQSFKVKVQSGKEQLSALIGQVGGLPAPLTTAQKNALKLPLNQALAALNATTSDVPTACQKLDTFVAALNGPNGAPLTPAQRQALAATAAQIKVVLGCGAAG